ncbi:MAG: hypothetical protein AB1351_00240 [Thermoproteota archaeon]
MDILAETKKLILKKRDEGRFLSDPELLRLGFKKRELTTEEKSLYNVHQFDSSTCYFAKDDTYDITVLERSWDRSKSFQLRGDRIEITLIAKNVKSGEVIQEKFDWNEKSIFGGD